MRSITGRIAILFDEKISSSIMWWWWNVKNRIEKAARKRIAERETQRLNAQRIEAERKSKITEKNRLSSKAFSKSHFNEKDPDYLLNLIQAKKLSVVISGINISRIRIIISNCTGENIRFFIPPGIIFLSNGVHQNMASVKTMHGNILPKSSNEFKVSSVCINRHRPVPDKDCGFREMVSASGPLLNFLRAIGDDYFWQATIQAGVWAITDRLGKSDFSEEAGFEPKHIEQAWEILRAIDYVPKGGF